MEIARRSPLYLLNLAPGDQWSLTAEVLTSIASELEEGAFEEAGKFQNAMRDVTLKRGSGLRASDDPQSRATRNA